MRKALCQVVLQAFVLMGPEHSMLVMMHSKPQPGSAGGHVPDGLIYGPVLSRRFGISLGISFSLPGEVGCRWRCPYCQLGGGGDQVREELMADPDDILKGLQQALSHSAQSLDMVTIAGAGEPLDHPQAVELLRGCQQLCAASGLPLALLTNGDALVIPEVWQAVSELDRAYIKWDPGAPGGSWRTLDQAARKQRHQALADLPHLRIQSLLFATAGGGRGNISAVAQGHFIHDMQALRPCELHLTTADRDDPAGLAQAVSRSCLEEWAANLQPHCPDLTINVYAQS